MNKNEILEQNKVYKNELDKKGKRAKKNKDKHEDLISIAFSF